MSDKMRVTCPSGMGSPFDRIQLVRVLRNSFSNDLVGWWVDLGLTAL